MVSEETSNRSTDNENDDSGVHYEGVETHGGVADGMSEPEAVDALARFGLTTYEARVFVGLQKLGTGTASDVAEVADVPRSQVYGAAEGLEAHGLIEVQQTTPTRYRPVPLEEAKARLIAEFRSVGENAFSFLEEVRHSCDQPEDRTEAIWTVEGRDTIAARVVELAESAEDHVFYGAADARFLEPAVREILAAKASESVSVVASSEDPDVLEALQSLPGVTPQQVPSELANVTTTRVLVADGDTVLLSVVGADALPDSTEETAIWSSGTAFAAVIVALVEEWAETYLTDPES